MDLYRTFNQLLLVSNVYFLNNYQSIRVSFEHYLAEIKGRIEEIEKTYIENHPGRDNVSVNNPIDWDHEPTIFQKIALTTPKQRPLSNLAQAFHSTLSKEIYKVGNDYTPAA